MEQSPSWEANSHSFSQEIHRLLQNPKVHYRVHKGPPLVHILSQMTPVHILPPCFPKIHSNIIFPSTPRPSKLTLLFMFSNKNILLISHFFHRCYVLRHLILLNLITRIVVVEVHNYEAPHYAVLSSLPPHPPS